MIDVFDILAIIFGIIYTVRKLDVLSRKRAQYPHVLPEHFDEWQQREAAIYSSAVLACALKVVLDLAWSGFFLPKFSGEWARIPGALIDLSWAGFLLLAVVRSRRMAKVRYALGITQDRARPLDEVSSSREDRASDD